MKQAPVWVPLASFIWTSAQDGRRPHPVPTSARPQWPVIKGRSGRGLTSTYPREGPRTAALPSRTAAGAATPAEEPDPGGPAVGADEPDPGPREPPPRRVAVAAAVVSAAVVSAAVTVGQRYGEISPLERAAEPVTHQLAPDAQPDGDVYLQRLELEAPRRPAEAAEPSQVVAGLVVTLAGDQRQ